MRQEYLDITLPKNPEYWYEVEFSIPRRGMRPASMVMDVLADDLDDAEHLAVACGPSLGIVSQVFKRGTSADYRREHGIDG